MKQLPMTPELSAMIKKAVGDDVETDDLAVFETIALNTVPLPGKSGTIFENAVVEPITLMQMVDHVNAGNHLPLISDHDLSGAPHGRFFHAGLDWNDNSGMEMRALFYLDSTEKELITKLNSGSLDEVSVSFLSSAFECSECGWDYFQFGSDLNINSRTCQNGHTIGQNGTHARMIGLNQFVELSLVGRGAANNPKIVGKSAAKLAPETTYRLAAHGFTPTALVLQASIGTKEEINMDAAKLMADLTAEIRTTATLTAEKATLQTNLSAAETARDAALADVARLTTELSEAKAAKPEGLEAAQADQTAALSYLGKQFDHLTQLSGKAKVEGDARPKTVAEFSAKIDELTGGLTSIIPVGGKAEGAGKSTDTVADKTIKVAAFSLSRK